MLKKRFKNSLLMAFLLDGDYMFRKMRRAVQELSRDDTIKILERATNGILAITANSDVDENFPYAVPISFAYHNDRIYFHSALTGHKIDLLRKNPRVSFCVVDKDEIIPEKFTTAFKSVIAFGTMEIVENNDDKLFGLQLLAEKYSPGIDSTDEIDRGINHCLVLILHIEHLTGKQGKELVKIGVNHENQ